MNHTLLHARAILVVAVVLCASPTYAGVLFQDSFDTGQRSATVNGFAWADHTDGVTVSTSKALSGSYSLQFPFQGVPLGDDSWQEQRLRFGKAYTELWVKFDLYVPSNYYHRQDGASNNKFFAIFNNNYTPGFQVNFSTRPNGSGGSNIEVHYFQGGHEQPVQTGGALIGSTDLGKWMRIVMHFKVPSSLTSADGVQELWKNGQQVYSNKALASNGPSGYNYMDEAYVLGWANSGFTDLTTMCVDDFVMSDAPIALTNGEKVPEAPVVSVQ
jgi:hypothetical protein